MHFTLVKRYSTHCLLLFLWSDFRRITCRNRGRRWIHWRAEA